MSEAYFPNFDGAYKKFRFIHNGNASDPLVPGDVVEYELAATADYPGQSVVDGTAADPLTAGVVTGSKINGGTGTGNNIAAGEWGWIQVSGFCNHITTDGSISAGDILIGGAAVADAGTLGTNDYAAFGVALADDSSTTLASAVIKGVF